MTNSQELSVANERPRRDLLAKLADRKMDHLLGEVEMYQAVTGQVFESLPLSGDLTLRREVLGDKTRGPIEMTYQNAGFLGLSGVVTYDRVTTGTGKVVYTEGSDGDQAPGKKLGGFRRAMIMFKLLKGRSDHWARESDFYGAIEEEDF